ncbi:MAG TPA: sigma-70 family RNA polymerase sigma factor [Gemmataceae bacterium]|jgi:RNA polymerase sigma-70 factor (ECF subfamily)|nr:sigma-70 family RNA polymerase sigma factor [Gemmataceae bacterium]
MRWPGTTRSIEELVDGHYGSLYRYAFRLSGKAQEAEDLTQEAFCQAQTKWSQLRDVERARSWLFTILRNAYLHKLRDRKMENALSLEDVGDLAERAADPLPAIDPRRLQEALDELPEGFRSPIILFYFEDFSYRDIADQMQIPIGTVMSRLARAKSFLRNRLVQPPALLAGQPGREDA